MQFDEPVAILGCGIDLCRVPRIEQGIERHQERFLTRLFTEEEVAYCSKFSNPATHYAARFAAKEAFSKCLGTGIGKAFGWKDAAVGNFQTGAPYLTLSTKALETVLERFGVAGGRVRTFVSLTHDTDYASAMVILAAAIES